MVLRFSPSLSSRRSAQREREREAIWIALARKREAEAAGEAAGGGCAVADPLSPSPDPARKKAAAAEEETETEMVGGSDPISIPIPVGPAEGSYDWDAYVDFDIMQQHSAIRNEAAAGTPLLGDKEPLSSLAAEYESGSPILQEKIKLLGEEYSALRRTRGDGNCFFRAFMFSYLEHVLETQDKAEVDRITATIEECKMTLVKHGYADFTFEDFAALFMDQLEFVSQAKGTPESHEELLNRCRDQPTSDYVVMFFRFVTSGELRRRAEFFEPFIFGLTNATIDKFCRTSVEPMGEESDHVHIIALSDALGVPIRVMYLDNSSCDTGIVSVKHYDFIPGSGASGEGIAEGSGSDVSQKPFVTLLYRPGHYDILYSK